MCLPVVLYFTHTHTHTSGLPQVSAQGPISCFPQASSRPSYNLRLSLAYLNPNWYLMFSLNLRGQTAVCVFVCACVNVCVKVLSQVCHRGYYQERAKRKSYRLHGYGVVLWWLLGSLNGGWIMIDVQRGIMGDNRPPFSFILVVMIAFYLIFMA